MVTVNEAPVSSSATLPKLMKHACRTLIKKGDPDALNFYGFGAAPQIKMNAFSVSPDQIKFGEKVTLNCEIVSLDKVEQSLVIDYVIHFQKQNNKTATRVLKWGTRNIAAGETISLQKSHAIVPVTVRKYCAGVHKVELQINGAIFASASFVLLSGSDHS